jgi:hypothetical protein
VKPKRFSQRSSSRGETRNVAFDLQRRNVMERRHFLKLTFGFIAGASVLGAAAAEAAPLPPVAPEQGLAPRPGERAEPAITTQDDVDRLAPDQVRWHRRHWGWRRRHWGWRRRHWGWRRRHWGWRRRHWGWRRRHWRRRYYW